MPSCQCYTARGNLCERESTAADPARCAGHPNQPTRSNYRTACTKFLEDIARRLGLGGDLRARFDERGSEVCGVVDSVLDGASIEVYRSRACANYRDLFFDLLAWKPRSEFDEAAGRG